MQNVQKSSLVLDEKYKAKGGPTMKKSRIAAWALAAVMAVSTATAYVPANAAVKVNKVTVASSLSGNKKTVVVAKGKSVKLATTVKVKPNKKANKKVSYSVKDKKIATVNGKGVVKGNKVGTTKVTVTSAKNKKKKATITVKVVKAAVKKVTVNKKKASLNVGQTLKLKTTVKAGKGANKTIAFTTSKKKVATVNKKGVITAVGTGSAVITAKAIDGSGKKATCKVKVANPINLAAMNVLNARSVTFALDKPLALTPDQVSVKKKVYASGNYNYALKINNMTTTDNVNYTAVLDNDSYIGVGAFVQVAIPSLTGTVKSLEMEYKDQVCAFTEEVVSSWTAGKYQKKTFSFGEGEGYSSYAISGVPAGLTAEVKGDSVVVKGVPTAAGTLDATLTAVDELGNTLTQTIHFIVGDDNTVVAASTQEYSLIGAKEITASNSISATGCGDYYNYSVVNDPSGIVTNKNKDNSLSSDSVSVKILVAGTYTVTVRATSIKDPTKYADANIVFNVKQGISIGGALKDAQGNPMADGNIRFTNKDRASLYCRYTYASFDYNTSTYSALVDPGVYDISASYSADDRDAQDYTLSTKYLYAQSLMTTATGYDIQLDDIYKVAISVPDYNNSIDWNYNHVTVGRTYNGSGAIYLKNGTYTIESDEISDYSAGTSTTTGDWFNGTVTKTTYPAGYKFTATFTVNGAAVAVPVAKVASGQPHEEISTTVAAKDTTAEVTELDETYWLDNMDTNGYYAYKFTPSEDASYEISNSNVYFYNMDGTKVTMTGGSYALKADTTYIVGSGSRDSSVTFRITKKVTSTEPETPETPTEE